MGVEVAFHREVPRRWWHFRGQRCECGALLKDCSRWLMGAMMERFPVVAAAVVGPGDDIEAAFDALGDAIGAAGIKCAGCGHLVNSPECKAAHI